MFIICICGAFYSSNNPIIHPCTPSWTIFLKKYYFWLFCCARFTRVRRHVYSCSQDCPAAGVGASRETRPVPQAWPPHGPSTRPSTAAVHPSHPASTAKANPAVSASAHVHILHCSHFLCFWCRQFLLCTSYTHMGTILCPIYILGCWSTVFAWSFWCTQASYFNSQCLQKHV